MSDSPPPETPSSPAQQPRSPPQSQPQPASPPQELETQNPNPNPNPISESEHPSQNLQPSTPETENPPQENPNDEQIQPEEEVPDAVVEDLEQQDEPEPENTDAEGMNEITVSSPTQQNPSISSDNNAQEIKVGTNPPVSSSVRRTTKRKKGSKNHASKAAAERKVQQLLKCWNPIPFVPAKAFDFSKHKELLTKLGLWDFAHIKFDRNIRTDLVGKLIVNYNPKSRCSYVDDFRISVSRPDLGRALALPKKLDCDLGSFPPVFLSFLDEFVLNWMLLCEDLWCMPPQIVKWTSKIKEGSPQEVDWAGLIWYMVEKELSQRTSLKDCYYASHLQHLIKVQKEELFRDIPNVEVESQKVVKVSKQTVSVEDDDDDDDDDDDGSDVKMKDFEESGSAVQKLEEQNIELRLGQDCVASVENVGDADKVEHNSECHADESMKVDDAGKAKEVDYAELPEGVDEGHEVENIVSAEGVDNAENLLEENKDVDMMDFADNMGEEQGQGHWFLDGKIGGQHFMRRCGMAGEDRGLEDVGEDNEVEADGHVEGFKIMQKNPLDCMSSANVMQALEIGGLPYSSTELGGQSSLELMSSREDNNVMLGGPSIFNHTVKREIDHDHDMFHDVLNGNHSHKKMRIEGDWDNKPHTIDMFVEQFKQLADKLKIFHDTATNGAYQHADYYFQQQLALKESEILSLKHQLGDLERSKQAELARLNRELYLMSSVIDGYRNALKQTQKTFSDYRKRCQVPDEPIYKDAGLGGVVKSVMELERERLKQEEHNKFMCSLIEETFSKTLAEYEGKWESEVLAKFRSHHNRLVDVAKEFDQLKDHLVKHEMPGNNQNEPECPSE